MSSIHPAVSPYKADSQVMTQSDGLRTLEDPLDRYGVVAPGERSVGSTDRAAVVPFARIPSRRRSRPSSNVASVSQSMNQGSSCARHGNSDAVSRESSAGSGASSGRPGARFPISVWCSSRARGYKRARSPLPRVWRSAATCRRSTSISPRPIWSGSVGRRSTADGKRHSSCSFLPRVEVVPPEG